ncbi:MAG: iron-containing redox enzyme family protein [Legionellales bacterium]|nr:iron-containing redox enzyme family protein [Legionellales bacterium]
MIKDEITTAHSFEQLITQLKQPLTTHSEYDQLDPLKLAEIRKNYAWIADPIYTASQTILTMPFFAWIKQLRNPQEFKCAAVQLYYHSATFPKVLGLMLGHTPMSENHMMPFYAKHALGEADHHQLLMKWMLRHQLLIRAEEINQVLVTPETNACINLGYRLAMEHDRGLWIAAINCGIERCSNDFFNQVAPKMHELNAGDIYFDVHVEADEYHSIMGLQYITVDPTDTLRQQQLIHKGLEGISLWAAMLHSWIGINYFPQFNLQGKLV